MQLLPQIIDEYTLLQCFWNCLLFPDLDLLEIFEWYIPVLDLPEVTHFYPETFFSVGYPHPLLVVSINLIWSSDTETWATGQSMLILARQISYIDMHAF
jgi:hypothetical protein